MARSSARGQRAPRQRAAAPAPSPSRVGVGPLPGPEPFVPPAFRVAVLPLAEVLAMTGPVRALFDFAALGWPVDARIVAGAGATDARGDALLAAVVLERAGRDGRLHGPVVRLPERPAEDAPNVLDLAAALIERGLELATAAGIETVFARPQGLDRAWVRRGFLPVPEGTLPELLGRGQGGGLFAWRGGSALWTLRGPGRE